MVARRSLGLAELKIFLSLLKIISTHYPLSGILISGLAAAARILTFPSPFRYYRHTSRSSERPWISCRVAEGRAL